MIVSVAPSAIRTGGRSMCGSPWASAPPTVATLRTRTFDSVRRVRVITGVCFRTSSERSSVPSVVIAPMRSPSAPALMSEYLLSILRRLMSFSGLNTPAFIISIKAVPPAIGRMLGSSGFKSLMAAASEVGSARSKGIIYPPAGFRRTRRAAALRISFPCPWPWNAAPVGRCCRACRRALIQPNR